MYVVVFIEWLKGSGGREAYLRLVQGNANVC